MYWEREHFDWSMGCACVNRKTGIFCRDSVHVTVRRGWAEQQQWKAPLMAEGGLYPAKGSGARYTWVRNEHFSGNMEPKTTHKVSQPPGITASQTRENAVILGAKRLSHLLNPTTSLLPNCHCPGLSQDSCGSLLSHKHPAFPRSRLQHSALQCYRSDRSFKIFYGSLLPQDKVRIPHHSTQIWLPFPLLPHLSPLPISDLETPPSLTTYFILPLNLAPSLPSASITFALAWGFVIIPVLPPLRVEPSAEETLLVPSNWWKHLLHPASWCLGAFSQLPLVRVWLVWYASITYV